MYRIPRSILLVIGHKNDQVTNRQKNGKLRLHVFLNSRNIGIKIRYKPVFYYRTPYGPRITFPIIISNSAQKRQPMVIMHFLIKYHE